MPPQLLFYKIKRSFKLPNLLKRRTQKSTMLRVVSGSISLLKKSKSRKYNTIGKCIHKHYYLDNREEGDTQVIYQINNKLMVKDLVL